MSSATLRAKSPEWTWIGSDVEIRNLCDASGRAIGIFERHQSRAGRPCRGGAILFEGMGFGEFPVWTPEVWNPLTIKTEIKCSRCGHSGWIERGKWVSWK